MSLVTMYLNDRHIPFELLPHRRAGTRLASEGELLVAFPRYELGALPPLGRLLGVPMLIDPQVLTHQTAIFAGGTETESVKVGTTELFDQEPKLVAPIARQPEQS